MTRPDWADGNKRRMSDARARGCDGITRNLASCVMRASRRSEQLRDGHRASGRGASECRAVRRRRPLEEHAHAPARERGSRRGHDDVRGDDEDHERQTLIRGDECRPNPAALPWTPVTSVARRRRPATNRPPRRQPATARPSARLATPRATIEARAVRDARRAARRRGEAAGEQRRRQREQREHRHECDAASLAAPALGGSPRYLRPTTRHARHRRNRVARLSRAPDACDARTIVRHADARDRCPRSVPSARIALPASRRSESRCARPCAAHE